MSIDSDSGEEPAQAPGRCRCRPRRARMVLRIGRRRRSGRGQAPARARGQPRALEGVAAHMGTGLASTLAGLAGPVGTLLDRGPRTSLGAHAPGVRLAKVRSESGPVR